MSCGAWEKRRGGRDRGNACHRGKSDVRRSGQLANQGPRTGPSANHRPRSGQSANHKHRRGPWERVPGRKEGCDACQSTPRQQHSNHIKYAVRRRVYGTMLQLQRNLWRMSHCGTLKHDHTFTRDDVIYYITSPPVLPHLPLLCVRDPPLRQVHKQVGVNEGPSGGSTCK